MNEKNINSNKEIKPLKNNKNSILLIKIGFFFCIIVAVLLSLFIIYQRQSLKEIKDNDRKILEQNLTTMQEKLEALDSKVNSLAALTQESHLIEKLHEIEEKIRTIEAWKDSLQFNFENYQQMQSALSKLRKDIESGHPYQNALSVIESLKIPAEAMQYLNVLKKHQDVGISTLLSLKDSLPNALNEWLHEDTILSADSFFKKTWFKVKSLIKIRKTEGFKETDVTFEANIARIEHCMKNDDFGSALDIINKEQKPFAPKIKTWVENADIYLKLKDALINLENLLQSTIINQESLKQGIQEEANDAS